MARILFFPVLIIILAIAAFLIYRVKSLFELSRSEDVVLSRPSPVNTDITQLIKGMLDALKALPSVEYQSDILVDYHRISSHSKNGSETASCKFSSKSGTIEAVRDKESILLTHNGATRHSISRENPWMDFWCGVASLEESLELFYHSGMRIMAGNAGTYMGRRYTEILIISHSMPELSGTAFEQCFEAMKKVFGGNLAGPDTRIRNFMSKILVNGLTNMPDFVETKFNLFRGDKFICDYMQNSRILY